MRPGPRVSGRSIALPAILALTAATTVVLAPTPASATPVIRQVRIASTDWVSGGVGGIGSGKGAGKGAAIGGLVGAGGGTLFGLNETRKHDEQYRDAYARCMRSRGYAS